MMSYAIYTFLGTPVKRTSELMQELPAKQHTAEDHQFGFLFVCLFYDHFLGNVINSEQHIGDSLLVRAQKSCM